MADSEQGIGKRILGFFIKDVDAPAPATAATAPAAPSTPAPPAKTTVSNAAGTAEVDRKFVEHFVNLLEKANLPGPDYFEYKQALQSMDTLGLGEEKQFQAAWASFKAMGGVKDPDILKTSSDQYLAILDKDRTSFLKDVEKAVSDRVGSLLTEQKNLEAANQTLAQQITELQKKIEDNKNRLGQISGEVTEQTARINANRDSFEVTYQSFVQQIKSDQQKISQHLQ